MTPPEDRQQFLAVIRRLVVEQGLPHWRRYAFALAMMAVAAACTAGSTLLLGRVINEAYVNRNFPSILFFGLVLIALFAGKGIATYLQIVAMARASNAIVASTQRRVFERLLQQNLTFFATRHSSEFIARLNSGASATAQVLASLVNAAGRDVLSLIGLVTVMFLQDPMLATFSFVVMPPALIFLRKLVKRIYTIARNQFHGGAQILETMQETLQGIRVVKAFHLEDAMKARAAASIDAVERESNKMARVSNRSGPLMEALGGITIALALIYGGYRVIQTGAQPGEFFSFVTAFILAYEPAKRLARLNIELNTNLVGVGLINDVLDAPMTEPPDDDKPALRVSEARVEFRDVSFAYRTDEPVLRGLDLVAAPHQMTALVGQSGGGKSTILNLILRLYEPTQGAILIDGQNIAEISRASLRRQIAHVGQDIFLFRGTIRDNIRFGKADATEDEIVAAAKAANAHDFVTAFPDGYDTPVGEHGAQLSGGQRQRIAIARALVKDAALILLDEATGSLDSESELLVQQALDHLCRGRTTIVIAHRLHTVMHAQTICVIEHGQVVESGTHESLLRRGGRYASYFRLQDGETRLDEIKLALS